MTVNEGLRFIAGSMVLASLVLGYFWHPAWYLLTVFVALNLMQSAFTHWCPMMAVLRRLGLREA